MTRAIIDGLPGWTDEDVRRAALDAPRRAYVRFPGLEVIERPGWCQLVAPMFREAGLNGVWHCALPDDDADAAIDGAIAEYAALGVRFRWLVDDESRPRDLAARLAARGLTAEPCRIMARATARPVDAPADPDITVERVARDDDDARAAFDAVATGGWELDPAPFIAYHRILLDDPAGAATLYLARWRGEPAATALHLRIGRTIFLVAGVVLPAHRGRGLYRALVAARLRDAASEDRPLAITLARASTSAPILDRLGFVTVSEATSFGS